MLKTRYGTVVTLKGGICKKYSRKLRMEAEAIERFQKGFPATWKKILKQSFCADILKESDSQIQPRRSVRNREKRSTAEPVELEDRTKLPDCVAEDGRLEGRRLRSFPGKPSKRQSLRKKTLGIKLLVEEPVRKSAKRGPSEGPAERPAKLSLAGKLKDAQEAKKARRARRVAFADIAVSAADVASSQTRRTPRPKRVPTAVVTPGENSTIREEWSDSQRVAFERQRNSVAADAAEYWEVVASGVNGKNAQECRELWECSWTSPRAKEARAPSARSKMGAEEMVADLQKAVRSKRSRNTAKFRSQTRHLAELVAEGTHDAALEPSVPGAAAAQGVAVTPRLQNVGALSRGTPGTEVRQKREQNEREGTVPTPEILSRGRKVGFAEADHYVSLFKRRAGKGGGKAAVKAADVDGEDNDLGTQSGIQVQRRLSDDEDVRQRDKDGEGSDYSDESCPFF